MNQTSSSVKGLRRNRGFTLIEVLVVVAIIALLISILLPSLARAREQARTAQCLSQLQQLGRGLIMYTNDNRGSLPGPIHYALYIGTSSWFTPGDPAVAPNLEQGRLWAERQVPFLLSRYLGDRRAQMLDRVATCPTSARIPKAPIDNPEWFYKLPAHYIANSGGNHAGPNEMGNKPYYATAPSHYFGSINVGGVDHLRSMTSPVIKMPKKLESIKQHSREWALADLWYWRASSPRGALRRVGTWPFNVAAGESRSITNTKDQLKVPSYPFHLTTSSFDPDHLNSTDRSLTSPRLTTGRTAAMYLDGHATTVLRWEGTVNPCGPTAPWPPCD
jgi:prepilin-type N-terminal cleavage/methylation domain-containing protein